ncbi:hypothetical protein ON010_g10095 [Phytophthora cinnamomi]|nr:hypothetical protein ON010_g10095 [Phytophthora cinnamomi]
MGRGLRDADDGTSGYKIVVRNPVECIQQEYPVGLEVASSSRTKDLNQSLCILASSAQTTFPFDRHVFILHLGADVAELGADVEDFIAMMKHIAAFCHLHAEELALQVDASSLLRPPVERTQSRPGHPRFLAVVDHMMIVSIHVEQHQAERDVARLDVVVLGPRVREAWFRLAVRDAPHRLGQEHATHVAVPRGVVVAVELVDGDLGVLDRGHGAWAHNLKKVVVGSC